MMSSKILLLENLIWSATALCNENPSITKTDDLNRLYSTVLKEFKAKCTGKILNRIGCEISSATPNKEICEILNKETNQISIQFNENDHNVIFKYLYVTNLAVTLKVEISSLDTLFVLKQGIMPHPNRFNEIERLNEIQKHDNIVKILYSDSQIFEKMIGLEENTDCEYLISWVFMEYLGFDFYMKLNELDNENKTIDQGDLIKMLKHILSALDKCHDRNIVHGDIKQENIMGRIKNSDPMDIDFVLIDFANSIQLNGDETETDGLEFKVGTDGFFAPEVIDRCPKLAKPSDIWSFGIMVFQLASTNGMIKAKEVSDSFIQLTQKDIFSEIRKLKCLNEIKILINECLQIKMEKRATVKQLREYLSLTFPGN